MKRIGLTGGIGSGKSTVARIFETLGIPVYYADEAARRLMNSDPELKEKLQQHFGPAIYQDGVLNRKALAQIVFNDREKLELLNAITHPVTIKDADLWMRQQKAPYVIKEAALLFESGAAEHLDEIIGVYAPMHIRIKRVMKRDGSAFEEVKKRMERQLNEEMKMKLCDHVIRNNEEELLIPQVLALHARYSAVQ